MNNWSFDILRQSPWDIWVLICVVGCVALAGYVILTKAWTAGPRGWAAVGMASLGCVGTAVVLFLPGAHGVHAGLFWTFFLLALVSATFYLSLWDRLGRGRVAALLSLRIVALLMLVSMLFEPVVRFISRPTPERPILFCVDTSGSMSFPDVQNGPTRMQSIWQTLSPQLPRLDERFLPRYFRFDTTFKELDKVDDLSRLQADGRATDIVNGVRKTLAQSTRPDAAVVLVTDGNDNTNADVVDALRSAGRPIYTVRVGSELTEPATLANIAVADVDAADDFVVGHETQVKALIRSTALANRVVDVQMAEIDAKGKAVSAPVSKKLVLQPVVEGQTVTLPFKPTTIGVHRLAVWVDPVAGERSLVDNRQEFQGLAIDPRIKVLYIEGRARPEFRDLNRLLNRDPNVELATLLRIQKDRFSASGSVDGEPFKQMPETLEEWKQFDVILIGDLDATFLPRARQEAIERTVLEGGSLLMIGGQNTFGPGGYANSPIEKALPVQVGAQAGAQEHEQFVPRLTAIGAAHPAMEGLSVYFGVDARPPEKVLPPLRGSVVVGAAKEGAQVLLMHAGVNGPDGKPQVVLAVERYGKGRSAAFTIDTTYLWALPLFGLGQDSPYNRVWGQLIRWLAGADVRNRQRGPGIEGLLNKNVYQLGENVKLRATVRDERGDATRFAQVSLKLTSSSGGSTDATSSALSLNPVESHTGMYELLIPHPAQGEWKMELVATKDGKSLGKQSLGFTVIPPADEMLKIAANPALLRSLAEATGGSAYQLRELPALIDELIRADKHPAGAKQVTVPLDNFPRAFLAMFGREPQWSQRSDLPTQAALVLIVLVAEWALRRHWQLR